MTVCGRMSPPDDGFGTVTASGSARGGARERAAGHRGGQDAKDLLGRGSGHGARRYASFSGGLGRSQMGATSRLCFRQDTAPLRQRSRRSSIRSTQSRCLIQHARTSGLRTRNRRGWEEFSERRVRHAAGTRPNRPATTRMIRWCEAEKPTPRRAVADLRGALLQISGRCAVMIGCARLCEFPGENALRNQ